MDYVKRSIVLTAICLGTALRQDAKPAAPVRPHGKKLIGNDHVIVWSYRWSPGEPTPAHFHNKDVVVVYLEDTALISTTPDDRTHTELLELK